MQSEQALPAGLVSEFTGSAGAAGITGAEGKLSAMLLEQGEANGETGAEAALSRLLLQTGELPGEAGAERLAHLVAAGSGESAADLVTTPGTGAGEAAASGVLSVPADLLAEALGIDPALIAQQSGETGQTAEEGAAAGSAAQLAASLQSNPDVPLKVSLAPSSGEETDSLAAVLITPEMQPPSGTKGLDLALLRAGDGSGGKGLEIALIRAGQAQGQGGAQQPAPANAAAIAAIANAAGTMNAAGGATPAADTAANAGARVQAETGLLMQQATNMATGAKNGKPQQNGGLPKPGKSGGTEMLPLKSAPGGHGDGVQTIRILKLPASPVSGGTTQQFQYGGDGETTGITPSDTGAGGVQQRAAATPSGQATPQQSQTTAQSLAVHIAQQARNGARRFDIRLEPPELGRVDVRLDVSKNGQVTTHLVVERSETLDLLQRDSRALERALQNAGLDTAEDGLKFSLKDHGQAHGDQDDENGEHAGRGPETDREADSAGVGDDAQEAPQRYVASSALDIRI